MSLKIISLSASLLKYSPVPYTSHLLMMPGGNMRTLLRMAASSFATGLSSSDATMSMGYTPELPRRFGTTLWNGRCWCLAGQEPCSHGNM